MGLNQTIGVVMEEMPVGGVPVSALGSSRRDENARYKT
jgi:hypothetical protein